MSDRLPIAPLPERHAVEVVRPLAAVSTVPALQLPASTVSLDHFVASECPFVLELDHLIAVRDHVSGHAAESRAGAQA